MQSMLGTKNTKIHNLDFRVKYDRPTQHYTNYTVKSSYISAYYSSKYALSNDIELKKAFKWLIVKVMLILH